MRKDETDLVARTCQTAYVMLHRAKHVLAICEALGLQVNRPNQVTCENITITWDDIIRFMNIGTGFKNVLTFYVLAVKVNLRLRVQTTATLTVDNQALRDHLKHMLGETVLRPDIRDHNDSDQVLAAEAASVKHAEFKRRLEAVGV